MCVYHGGKGSDDSNWLGGIYQVYPIERDMPDIHPEWETIDIPRLQAIFPMRLEAYCVFALLIASGEINQWAGASYAYLDRLAIGPLRRHHSRSNWKGIWRFVSHSWDGRVREISRLNMAIHLTGSFVSIFWGSMRHLVDQGCVEASEKESEYSSVPLEIYSPTPQLVQRINFFLSNS